MVCPQFAINECEEHCKSRLDTVTVGVDLGRTEKFRFLIDTGAEISIVRIVRSARLRPEINYEPTEGTDVKGISNALLRTGGTVLLKLFTLTHETTHLFHVMGESFDCWYDGILGQDFWRNKGAIIDYCNCEITMGEVVMEFDDKPDETTDLTRLLTLKSRTESIVRLPTKSRGFGIIYKRELAPGVCLAETLTKGVDGYCVTSIVNTSEENVTIEPPFVELEEVENDCDNSVLIFLLQ